MKSYIAIALLLAFASAISIKAGEKSIDFEVNPVENSLFGMVLKGSIDPKNELNNKISTFLKLANIYIPVLESMNNKDNKLRFNWCNSQSLGPLGMISWCSSANLMVGWNVYINSSTSTTGNYLAVGYVPFAWGWADANITMNNFLAAGTYNSTLYYTRTYAIVDV